MSSFIPSDGYLLLDNGTVKKKIGRINIENIKELYMRGNLIFVEYVSQINNCNDMKKIAYQNEIIENFTFNFL